MIRSTGLVVQMSLTLRGHRKIDDQATQCGVSRRAQFRYCWIRGKGRSHRGGWLSNQPILLCEDDRAHSGKFNASSPSGAFPVAACCANAGLIHRSIVMTVNRKSFREALCWQLAALFIIATAPYML